MAKQRMLRPEAWESAQVNALTDWEYRIWTGTWSHADDHGRVTANPNVLAGKLFPRRGDLSLPDKIQKAIVVMESLLDPKDKTPLVGIYQVGDEAFIFHPKWDMHQIIPKTRKSRSRLPNPPGTPKAYQEHRKKIEAFGYKLGKPHVAGA